MAEDVAKETRERNKRVQRKLAQVSKFFNLLSYFLADKNIKPC